MTFLNQRFQDAYNDYLSALSFFNELSSNDIQIDTAVLRLSYTFKNLGTIHKELNDN